MLWLIWRSIVSGGGVHLWLINKLIYTVERGGGREGVEYDLEICHLLLMMNILARVA